MQNRGEDCSALHEYQCLPPEHACTSMHGELSVLFLHRFKVFADYEDYIKCQEKVNALYKVRIRKQNDQQFDVQIDRFHSVLKPEPQGMDQEGDLQHRRMREVLQRPHHHAVRSRDLGHGAHAGEAGRPRRQTIDKLDAQSSKSSWI